MSTSEPYETILNDAKEIAERILHIKTDSLNEKPQEVSIKFDYDAYDCFEEYEESVIKDLETTLESIPEFGLYKQATLKKIAQAAVLGGALDAATKISTKMEVNKHQRQLLETIIKQHLQAKNLQQAYQVCLSAEHPIMRVQLLSMIHPFQNIVGYNEACKEAIKETIKLVEQKSLKKNTALKHIARLLAKIDETDSALKTIEGIDDTEIKIMAWCSVTEYLAEQGNNSLSQKIFSDAIQAAKTLQRIPSQHKSLERIADTKAKLGDISYAVSVAESIEWSKERAENLNYWIETLPYEKRLGFGLTCVINSYKEDLKWGITRHRILSHIAEIQAQKGFYDEAEDIVKLIDWDLQKCKALLLIGKASLKSGKKELSRHLFFTASSIAVESKHLDMELLLREIVIQQAELGDYESAHKSSMLIKAVYDRAETLAKISESRARISGYSDARGGFREAIEVAIEIYDVGRRIDTLIKVAMMEAEAGGKEEACNTINTAKDLTCNLTEWFSRFDKLLDIAFTEVKMGQTEKARQTFKDAEKLVEDNDHIHLIEAIAIKQVEAGFKEDALQSCRKLVKKPSALLTVAATFLKRGEIGYFLSTVFLFPIENGLAKNMLCILLAQAFPEKADVIADSVIKYLEDAGIVTISVGIEFNKLSEFLKDISI